MGKGRWRRGGSVIEPRWIADWRLLSTYNLDYRAVRKRDNRKMERQRSLSVASDVSGSGRGRSISGVPLAAVPGPADIGTLQSRFTTSLRDAKLPHISFHLFVPVNNTAQSLVPRAQRSSVLPVIYGNSEGSDMETQIACLGEESICQRQGKFYSLCPQRLLTGAE